MTEGSGRVHELPVIVAPPSFAQIETVDNYIEKEMIKYNVMDLNADKRNQVPRVMHTCDIARLNLETRIALHRCEMDPDELVVYRATQAFNYFNYLLDPMTKDGNCLHGI